MHRIVKGATVMTDAFIRGLRARGPGQPRIHRWLVAGAF